MTNGLIRLGYRHRHQPDGAGPDAGRGGHPRHPLAEEPPQGAERGLCRADLSPHGRDAIGAARAPARPYALDNRLSEAEYDRPRRARRARRMSSSTATTISIAARAMARSSASSRPTTSARRSSPIPAAFRWASPSTAPAICISCVGAMGLYSIAKDGEVTKLSAETTPLLDLDRRRCAAARSQRLRRGARTGGSSSPIPPRATTPMTGRWIRSRAGRPGACSATTRAPARPRPCSTTTAMPTASASPMTASRCSSPNPGPAACIATGSTGRRPARSNA